MNAKLGLTLGVVGAVVLAALLGGSPARLLLEAGLAAALLFSLWTPSAASADQGASAEAVPPAPPASAGAPPPTPASGGPAIVELPQVDPGALGAEEVMQARRVVHDLNNALTTVVSCAGELQLSLAEDDECGEVVDDLEQASARAVRLARDLRNVLRNRPAAGAEPALNPGGSEQILLVDDEQSVRRTISRLLGGAGYQVLEAGSAPEALAVCEANAASLRMVLTDVWMPEVDGLVLAREINGRYPSVPVLLMTGHVAETQALVGDPVKNATILAKPFSANLLMRRVRETLDGIAPPLPLA